MGNCGAKPAPASEQRGGVQQSAPSKPAAHTDKPLAAETRLAALMGEGVTAVVQQATHTPTTPQSAAATSAATDGVQQQQQQQQQQQPPRIRQVPHNQPAPSVGDSELSTLLGIEKLGATGTNVSGSTSAAQMQQPPLSSSGVPCSSSSGVGAAVAAQQARRAQLAQREMSASSSAGQSVASTVSLSQVPGAMSATSVEEAPLPGVQPEDILRTFYAVVEPGKQNLEKAIRQVLKEVDSRKTTLDKTCNRLKKATGHHPYAVWRKSKCVDATPPVRADSSRSAGSIDTLTKTEIQDEQSDHLSALVAQEDGMLQYYAKEGDEPKIISFYSQDAGEIRRMEIERKQRIQSKRVEADRQWGLMQQQQKEGDQNMLRYLRAKQKWQHLGHQSRLDAIRYYEQDGEPVRRSRPRLARSDGSRTSRDSNSASGGNDGSNDVVGDERTHRARDRTNVKGGAGIRREFEGLDSSGQIDDFDDIQKVAYIAKGASGAVYKAKWQGMFCAVKVFEGQYSDPDVLDAFYQEVDILKNMHHENLVRFYGFGTEPTPFIVTEFLLGNLSDLLYGKKKTVELNDKRQVLITLGMANGLAFLHWKGICHRDLKSPNVLYNRDLYIKLCDFAFSKFKSKVEDETLKFESRVGTPAWMAPEVLRGEEYTLSADVYSYGVIIWEMVTRSEPFKGVNAYAIAHQVGTGGRRLEVPADCPPFWRRLMLRCWAEPDERPSSAEIVKMLQKLRTDIANGRTIADGAGEPEDPQPEPEPEPEPQPQPKPKPESQLESQPEPEPE